MARRRKGTRTQQRRAKAEKKEALKKELRAKLGPNWRRYLFDRDAVFHTGLMSTGRITEQDGEKCEVCLDEPLQQLTIAKAMLDQSTGPVRKLTYKYQWIDGNFMYFIKAWHSLGSRKIRLRRGLIRDDGHCTTTQPHTLIINGRKEYDFR